MTPVHKTERSKRRQAVADQPKKVEEAISRIPALSEKVKQITKAIVVFITKDLHPYSVVENLGFRAPLHTLEPNPCRRLGSGGKLFPSEKKKPLSTHWPEGEKKKIKKLGPEQPVLHIQQWTSGREWSYTQRFFFSLLVLKQCH